MAVRQVKSTWYYDFMIGGKREYGTCTGCSTRREAEVYCKEQKRLAREVRGDDQPKRIIQRYVKELTCGTSILIGDAWDSFMKKPRKHRMGAQFENAAASRWRDFTAFMGDRYPSQKTLAQVTRQAAEEYITHVRTSGRWNKVVIRKRKGYRKPSIIRGFDTISPATANQHLRTCKLVFATLGDDAAVTQDPFARIDAINNDYTLREAFTPEQLKLIGENATGDLYDLFLIGINTGLREGDICTLRWAEIDLAAGQIKRRMRKTGKTVEIPILPGLRARLEEMDKSTDYLLPTMAARYLDLGKRSKIGTEVTLFLEGLGIEATRKIEGRSRRVSVRDVHSLRHTFCYLAGLSGVPLPVVQSIVGHMDEKMTKHYSDHATRQAKQAAVTMMPSYLGLKQGATVGASAEERLAEVRAMLEGRKDLSEREQAILVIVG